MNDNYAEEIRILYCAMPEYRWLERAADYIEQKEAQLAELEAKVLKLESDIREMVEKAAKKHLPAYREQDKRIAELEAQCAKWSELDNKAAGRIAELEAELAEAQKYARVRTAQTDRVIDGQHCVCFILPESVDHFDCRLFVEQKK